MIIETERLLLREFTVDDSQFILELLNSEGWLKYIGDRNIKTTEQAINYLENVLIEGYRMHGYGFGLVALKKETRPIGLCGLIKRDHLPHIDIGFAFLPSYIGKGYGYEIAKKTLQYGFQQLQQEKIIAITLPTNSASIKLLEKLGLTYESRFVSKDKNEELLIYGISKDQHDEKNKNEEEFLRGNY
jgi:RimJ/RimL family protein N-acetyltransferase